MNEGIVVVQPYQESDHNGVVPLWSNVFPDDPPWNEPKELISRKRTVDPNLFWVARCDHHVIGTVLAGYDGVRGWIYHLAVDPAQRRRGTARLLMQTAERALEALGCAKINLQVRSNNTGVIEFYKALGYTIEERVQMGKPIGKYQTR